MKLPIIKTQYKIMFYGFLTTFFLVFCLSIYMRRGWNDWLILFIICFMINLWALYGVVKKYKK